MQGSTGDEGLALSTDSALEMPFSEAIFNYFSPAGFLDWKYTRTEGKKKQFKICRHWFRIHMHHASLTSIFSLNTSPRLTHMLQYC